MAMLAASASLLMWPIPRCSPLNHPTSIRPTPLLSRRLSQKSPLTFLYSLNTTTKAKPQFLANLWTYFYTSFKRTKSLPKTFFLNSLINWNEIVPGNKKYFWMLNCGVDLWMSEFSLFPALWRIFWDLAAPSHKMCFGYIYASSQIKKLKWRCQIWLSSCKVS